MDSKLGLKGFEKICKLACNHYGSPLGCFSDGIVCVNDVRNRYAHELGYKIDKKHIKILIDIMKDNFVGKIFFDGEDVTSMKPVVVIQSFVKVVCLQIEICIQNRDYLAKPEIPSYVSFLENEADSSDN